MLLSRMTWPLKAFIGTAAVFMIIVFVAQPAVAQLSLKSCLKASAERDALAAQGYEKLLDLGPQKLRTKMTPTILIGVKRLIYLIEILEFRCSREKLAAWKKHINSPAFRHWKALNPPLPRRKPRFVRRRWR